MTCLCADLAGERMLLFLSSFEATHTSREPDNVLSEVTYPLIIIPREKSKLGRKRWVRRHAELECGGEGHLAHGSEKLGGD